jgi:hypothetical protein
LAAATKATCDRVPFEFVAIDVLVVIVVDVIVVVVVEV